MTQSISAKVITVTNTNDSGAGSLREAIKLAASGDTIQFTVDLACQTITLGSGELVISKDLTIEAGAACQVTISSGNSSRVITTSSSTKVTLRDLVIADGKVAGTEEKNPSASAGGGILTGANSTLILDGCVVRDNVGAYGGGIFTGWRCHTTISRSMFSGNVGWEDRTTKSERTGGGIATSSGGSLTIRDSEFTRNRGGLGAAVNNLLGALTIENSKFTDNVAVNVGGAVYADGANATGPNSRPGPVGGSISIRSSLFKDNSASAGGGVYLFGYGTDVTLLESCYFINNKAVKGPGGGVHHGNCILTVRDCAFISNSCTTHGGGLMVQNDGDVDISNSTFSSNRAGEMGGGILVDRNEPFKTNILGCTLSSNSAGQYAGGVGIFKDTTKSLITARNTIFNRNTSDNPYKVRQHTGCCLVDGGNNVQYPAMLTRNRKHDSNATEGVIIADPLLEPLDYVAGVFIMRAGGKVVDMGVGVVTPACLGDL